MRGPARIEARLRDAARPSPPGGDHLGPVLATLMAEEDLLVAVLPDAFANLVECREDDVDIGPVGRPRHDQGNPLDLRLRGRFAIMLFQQLPGLEDRSGLLSASAGARSRGRDEGMAGLDLVAFRRRLAHHLDGRDNLADLQEAGLRLFERGLGDLRSVVGFCQGADLVGGAVELLAESDLAALQDCGEPVRERFDLGLETGAAQLAEQGLESLADDAVGQDVILGDGQLRVFLRQAEKFDGLVGVRVLVSHVGVSRCSGNHHGSVVAWPYVWFTESVRVRDGEAAGVPGAKVFRAHRPPRARHRKLDRPFDPRRLRRKVLRSLTRADLGAIRRICFRTHVCVF